MIGFKNSNFSSCTTVAEQLKFKRKEKGFSLKKISRKTNVNSIYLKALEEENYNKLPEGIYQIKIIKKYASFLGLNPEDLKDLFLKERGVFLETSKKHLFSVKRIKKGSFLVIPKIIKNIFIGATITVCFVYLGFYLNGIFSPPQLSIISPKEDSLIVQERTITILGQANSETDVLINNNQILNGQNRFFEKKIDLKQGMNIITITAQKKYGQKKVIKKQILVEES